MTITLNERQEDAVKMALWLQEQHREIAVGIVAGAAGVGKTTTLKAICAELGDVVLIAPTNRAAQRAEKLAGAPATTIHGWLYQLKDGDDGKPVFFKKGLDKIRIPLSNVIIVDEASMVGPEVWSDIWTAAQDTQCSILLVGDYFQLPPVVANGVEFSVFSDEFKQRFLDQQHPFQRVDLTEVFRQAKESPIIRACTELRTYPDDWRNAVNILSNAPSRDNKSPYGYAFPHPDNVPARVVGMIEAGMDHRVIAYTNDKRRQINREVRDLRGWTDEEDPQPGEPLLVRRNSKKAGVSNGEIIPFSGFIPRSLLGLPSNYRFMTVNGMDVLTSMDCIVSGVSPKASELQGLPVPFVDCQYGYCVTAHACQGDEADTAIVIWESVLALVYSKPEMRIRWAYTSMSRAKKHLLIGGLK